MPSTSDLKTPFWRQPLLHFALIALMIFAWDAIRPKSPTSDSYNIVVTVPQVERMVALWDKTWGRPPTDQELQGLVRDHIKEEIYYRQARRMGLEQNDVVIRRRLRQKMEFLSSDNVEAITVTEAELRDFHRDNAARYSQSPRFDLVQIYYKRDQIMRADADLVALMAGQDSEGKGDIIALPERLLDADERMISKTFGSTFWAALQPLSTQSWQGPIESGFGLHLVKISNKTPPSLKPFDTVREDVLRDFTVVKKQAALEAGFTALLSQYDVDIEMPTE